MLNKFIKKISGLIPGMVSHDVEKTIDEKSTQYIIAKEKMDRDLTVTDSIATYIKGIQESLKREASDREMQQMSVDTSKTAHDTQANKMPHYGEGKLLSQ